jgi:hypothetical protein
VTGIPAAGYFVNAARTNSEAKVAQDAMLEVMREQQGGSARTELTIATGAVVPDRFSHTVDTEGDAASDDLDNITTTNTPDGRWLTIFAANGARDVVVRHAQGGAGQVNTLDGLSVTLDDTTDGMLLERVGTDWYERLRFTANGLVVGVDVQAYDADTAKTDVSTAWTADQYFTPQADSSASNVLTVDFAGGNYAETTLTENITTMTLSNMNAGGVYKLRIKQAAAASYTITGWAAAIVWMDGDLDPTMNTAFDKYTMITIEAGTTEHNGSYLDFG